MLSTSYESTALTLHWLNPHQIMSSLDIYRRKIITSKRAQRAERVLSYLREKSEYSRPDPARSGPITLFKALYLRNRMSDRQAVFFDEYHLDVKVVWHGYHIASVPVMARGALPNLGYYGRPPKHYFNNRTTAELIGLRLGIQLGTQQTIHVCGSFFGCFSTCARAHPPSISRERLNRLHCYLACSWRPVSYVASTRLWGWHYARAHLHAPLLFSGTAEPIALRFGM